MIDLVSGGADGVAGDPRPMASSLPARMGLESKITQLGCVRVLRRCSSGVQPCQRLKAL